MNEYYLKQLRIKWIDITDNISPIANILTDGEGRVIALQHDLNTRGIILHPAGPGEHVPLIENNAKQVKQRIRAHLMLFERTERVYAIQHEVIRKNTPEETCLTSEAESSPVIPTVKENESQFSKREVKDA